MKKFFIIFAVLIILFIILYFIFNEKNNTKSIFSEIKNYEKENELRYQSYSLSNKNLSKEKIVTYVNMGLDNAFYTNIKTIKNVSTTSLVNKYYKLPEDFYLKNKEKIKDEYTNKIIYVDGKIIKDLEKMITDLRKNSLDITIVSGYRTKEYQKNLYNNYVKKDGKEKADIYSARSRHSEHELGLTIDVSTKNGIMEDFGSSKEFIWMKENASNYGFILRYPEYSEKITGYKYEPWHYRYVGKKHAKKIRELNITFDEYYELFLK